MLLPKRVKHRKQHRGRMTGVATRGNKVTYGQYGSRFSPTSPLPLVLPIPEWVKVKVTWITG